MTTRLHATLLLASLCLAPAAFGAEHEHEQHEDHIPVSQLPAAVQSSLQREGGTVSRVEKETEGGQTFYEARLSKDGHRYSLHIAPDGTVLKREGPEDKEEHERK